MTTRHDRGGPVPAGAEDEQVPAKESDIQLCDIIAQQREFQRRQESRGSQISHQNQICPQNQQQASEQQATGSKQAKGPISSRRKFSLSYAMSNIASLATGGAGSSGNLTSTTDTPSKRSFTPSRPPRGLQHRASLVTGGPTGPSTMAATDTVEKKKGFVHKAIRRGSKMFDAMMLTSSQSQADKESSQRTDRKTSADSVGCSGSNSVSPDRETGGSGQRRVEFASSIEEHDDKQSAVGASGEERARRRKPRRLRLGSIPHDLRRALSLSNNSRERPSSGHQRELAAAAAEVCQPAASPAPLRAAEEPTLPSSKQDFPKSRLQMGPELGPGAGLRLRRKNSLFSPLSHAVHHYGTHRVDQEASGGAPPAKLGQNATAASNTAGQSASFSLCQDHSRTYKLIIFGSSAVGKTSLIQRFLYGQFPVAHKPTVEELHSNKYNIPELGEIYLEILDTSGTFEFPAMRRLSIEKGDAFILVFSVSNVQSWEEVKHLREMILEEKGTDGPPPPPPPPPASAESHSEATSGPRSSPSQVARPRPSSTPMEQQPPEAAKINSVYAAATKLTSNRRLSTIGAAQEPPADNATSATSGERSVSQSAAKQVIASDNEPAGEHSQRPFTHYNSQLSKVLQQRQRSSGSRRIHHRKRPGLLQQSMSIDDRDSSCSSSSSSSSSGLGGGARLISSSPFGLRSRPPVAKKAEPLSAGSGRRCRTPIVVVANKCDLDESAIEVDRDAAERLVRDVWGNSFVCCSAKEALNIDRVFKELLRQARAPEILSQFVIDDHQQRRQSLPVLKNHLSAHHLKGLRNLYNQQQQQQQQQATASPGAPEMARHVSSSSEDSQCRIM